MPTMIGTENQLVIKRHSQVPPSVSEAVYPLSHSQIHPSFGRVAHSGCCSRAAFVTTVGPPGSVSSSVYMFLYNSVQTQCALDVGFPSATLHRRSQDASLPPGAESWYPHGECIMPVWKIQLKHSR